MAKIEDLRVNLLGERLPKGGNFTSDFINDFFGNLSLDLCGFAGQWDAKLCSLFSLLPFNVGGDKLNAVNNGLDGRTLFVDGDTEGDTYFYNIAQARPNSLREQFDIFYAHVCDWSFSVVEEFEESGKLLSDEVISRLGSAILDPALTSTDTSLDGRVDTLVLDIDQLAIDLYGATTALGGNGQPYLLVDVSGQIAVLRADVDGFSYAASDIPIADAGGYFTSANVEDALQEIADGFTFYGDVLPEGAGLALGGFSRQWDVRVDDLSISGESFVHNSLSVERGAAYLEDDEKFFLPSGVAGWVHAQIGDPGSVEYVLALFDSSAAITLVSGFYSANVIDSDTDGNLCIYDNANVVAIQNRLGSTMPVQYEAEYSVPEYGDGGVAPVAVAAPAPPPPMAPV